MPSLVLDQESARWVRDLGGEVEAREAAVALLNALLLRGRLALNADVVRPGTIRVGDAVTLE